MTANTFTSLCNEHSIDPRVALENADVRDLIKKDKGRNSITNQLHLNAILSTQF
jgi:hypothetical protein